ncbi:hypothetical protein OIO90_001763 [Microbotryomycetes sp. JL221]|nr:hypothetical protein OIO90_001763 [Microbotryomycetes sp. JL221]
MARIEDLPDEVLLPRYSLALQQASGYGTQRSTMQYGNNLFALSGRMATWTKKCPTSQTTKPISDIVKLGHKVLDALETPFTEFDDPEHHMTSNYFRVTAGGKIYRDTAACIFRRLARDGHDAERTDLFTLGIVAFCGFRGSDPFTVLRQLDTMAQRFATDMRRQHVNGDEPSTQTIIEQALAHMRHIGLRPAHPTHYHDINNLNERTHGFDIKAVPIGFPGTMLAAVSRRDERDQSQWVYVNVYKFKTVSRTDMDNMLRRQSLTPRPQFFEPLSSVNCCRRVADNIFLSIRVNEVGHSDLRSVISEAILAGAYCQILLADTPEPIERYTNILTTLVQEADFTTDVDFVEQELSPRLSTEHRERVQEIVQSIRQDDEGVNLIPKRRDPIKVYWPLGHVFRHRLFGYDAVIRGWDETCQATEHWIQAMQVDRLPLGRHQPFYHVFTSAGSTRYVAQENVTDYEVPETTHLDIALVPGIGRFFRKRLFKDRRWGFAKSVELCAQYPEDDDELGLDDANGSANAL